MARVLICEPHDDIRALLELVVRRMGHEPETYKGPAVGHLGVDAAVIEPGELNVVRLAKNLRAQNVPVLFTSIYPATAELLDLAPCAYLVKPFPLYALEQALERALEPASTAAAAAG
jgi:CheY-like chemotaxis protein